MQFKHSIFYMLFACILMMLASSAHADTVGFNGYVPQRDSNAAKTINQPGTLVSFSDEIALTIPSGFGSDGELRVINDRGEVNTGVQLLSLATDRGVDTRVAVVDLTISFHQTFLLCDGNSCIRYKVIRP